MSDRLELDHDTLEKLEDTTDAIITHLRQVKQNLIDKIEASRERSKNSLIDCVDLAYDRLVALAHTSSKFTAFEDLVEHFYDAKSEYELQDSGHALAALSESIRRILLANRLRLLRRFLDEVSLGNIMASLEAVVQSVLRSAESQLDGALPPDQPSATQVDEATVELVRFDDSSGNSETGQMQTQFYEKLRPLEELKKRLFPPAPAPTPVQKTPAEPDQLQWIIDIFNESDSDQRCFSGRHLMRELLYVGSKKNLAVFRGACSSGDPNESHLVFSKFYKHISQPGSEVYYSHKMPHALAELKVSPDEDCAVLRCESGELLGLGISPDCAVSRQLRIQNVSSFDLCRLDGQACVLLSSGDWLELHCLTDSFMIYRHNCPGVTAVNSFADDYVLLVKSGLRLVLVNLKQSLMCSEIDLVPGPSAGYRGKHFPNVISVEYGSTSCQNKNWKFYFDEHGEPGRQG